MSDDAVVFVKTEAMVNGVELTKENVINEIITRLNFMESRIIILESNLYNLQETIDKYEGVFKSLDLLVLEGK